MNIRTQLTNKLSADICFSEERILTEALCGILGQNYPIQALKGRLESKVYKERKVFSLDGVDFVEIYPTIVVENDGEGLAQSISAKFNYRVLL